MPISVWKHRWLLSLILSIGILLPTGVRGESSLLFTVDPWPPWAIGDYGPTRDGVAIKLVSEIFDRVGQQAEFILHPWRRVVKMVRFGQADGIVFVQKQEALNSLIQYSDPLFESRIVICYDKRRTPDFNWSEYRDLKDFTIGLNLGYNYGPLSKAIDTEALSVAYAGSLALNLKTLAARHIDLVVGSEAAIRSLILRHPEWDSFAIAKKPVASWDCHLGVSIHSPAAALLPSINSVIRSMKKDGSLKQHLAGIGGIAGSGDPS